MSDSVELPEVTELNRVSLGPDDVLVVSCPSHLSMQAVDRLATTLRQVFGEDRKILVLDGGTRLDAMGPDEA